jgi:AcrR family transcriptional regulator
MAARTGPRRGASTRRAATSRDARAAQRREQLLSVALDLFREHGFAATSTRRIAEAAGVAEGLVFHYFPSKEALLLALAARQQTFAGRVLALALRAGDATARELLHAIADGLAGVSPDELSFIEFMHAESQVNPLLRTMVRSANEAVLEQIVSVLGERVARGELREGAPLRAIALGFFGGFFFFFLQHRHLEPGAWRDEAARFAKAWAELCWRGAASSRALAEGPP